MEFAQISMRAEMALFSLPLRHLEAPNGVDHPGRNDVLLSVSVSTFAHNSLKNKNKKKHTHNPNPATTPVPVWILTRGEGSKGSGDSSGVKTLKFFRQNYSL